MDDGREHKGLDSEPLGLNVPVRNPASLFVRPGDLAERAGKSVAYDADGTRVWLTARKCLNTAAIWMAMELMGPAWMSAVQSA